MRNPYDTIGRIGLLLAIVGAINWLLVGIFEWNLVKWIFTQSGTETVTNTGERIVYIVVGVGGVLAIPMLAATLARARGRDVRSGEYERSGEYASRDRGRASDLNTNDTAYYMGAPKESRVEGGSQVAAASDEGWGREQTGPVRRTERVIIRTEEPLIGSTETSTSSESVSGETASTDTGQYDRVDEADDEYGTDTEQRRAA